MQINWSKITNITKNYFLLIDKTEKSPTLRASGGLRAELTLLVGEVIWDEEITGWRNYERLFNFDTGEGVSVIFTEDEELTISND